MARRFLFATLVLSLSLTAGSAWAIDGCFYGGYGPNSWGNNYGVQGFERERQPYFAMNPPVYYSGIETRPMGQSPYPYLPPIAPVGGQYASQYAQPAYYQQQPPQSQPPVVRPLMIRNPYYSETVSPPPPLPAGK